MDAQWAGVIGAAVGVVLTTASTWLAQHWVARRDDAQAARKESRENRQRFHPERLQAYTIVWIRLSTVQEVFQAAASAARPRFQSPLTPYRIARRLVSADAALREATEALAAIYFIGSGPVVAAANRCADVLVELNGAYADSGTSRDRIDDLVVQMNAARHEFLARARSELDVEADRPPGRPGLAASLAVVDETDGPATRS